VPNPENAPYKDLMMNNEKDTNIHCAKVYLQEARRRREGTFHAVLLRWAANCRLRAFHFVDANEIGQMEMFK
jgi:hypothetical protein